MIGGSAVTLAGLFAWTFIEYVIHGWLSHRFNTFAQPLHKVHHQDPHAVFTIGAWLPLTLITAGCVVGLGLSVSMLFLLGIVAGFVIYEAIHYRIHFCRPASAVEARLRARHILHHQWNPDLCFGVTSPLWDLVFNSEPLPPEMTALEESAAGIPPMTGRTNLHKLPDFLWRGWRTPSR
jgi:cyclopropane-fatty-acyl-phospholipid synthase